MSKQTAMQMAIAHYKKLSEEGSNQAYVIAKFLEENFLEIEKEQHFESYRQGNSFLDSDSFNFKDSFDKYYNETYGGNNGK